MKNVKNYHVKFEKFNLKLLKLVMENYKLMPCHLLGFRSTYMTIEQVPSKTNSHKGA